MKTNSKATLVLALALCGLMSCLAPVHAQSITNLVQSFEPPAWPRWMTQGNAFSSLSLYGWDIHGGFIHENGINDHPAYTAPNIISAHDGVQAWWIQDHDDFANPSLTTPQLPNGVGAVGFYLANYATGQNVFDMDISTNKVDWSTIVTLTNISQTWNYHELSVNSYDGVYLRLRKTSDTGDEQLLGIDLITMTKPPAKLAFSDPTTLPSPTFTDTLTDISIDITPVAEASNLVVRTYYSYRVPTNFINPSILMTNTVGDTWVTLSKIPNPSVPGTPVYYYVEATFEGPDTSSPNTYPAAGAAGPAYYVTRAIAPTSTYSTMEVVGDVNTNMLLVYDDEWQGVAKITNFTDSSFSFSADSGSETWQETDQPHTTLPVFGFAESSGSNMLISGTHNGYLTFRVNETSDQYSAQSAAYVDFNDWSLASNGVYTNAENWVIAGRTTTGAETSRAFEGAGRSLVLSGSGGAGGGGGGGGDGYSMEITYTNFAGRGTLNNFPVLVIFARNAGTINIPLVNAGFELPEQPDVDANPYSYYSDSNDGVGGWSWVGNGGIAENGSPWYDVNAPEGDQGGFIQTTGCTMSQTFTVTTAAVYQVAFRSIGRGGTYGPAPVEVSIDGEEVFSYIPSQTAWGSYVSRPVGLSVGNHTVSFKNIRLSGDLTSVIDDVAISSVTDMGAMVDFDTFLRSDGYDLRFYDSTETVELPYEIQSWSTNLAYVWVQVPSFTQGCSIWAKWGDPAVTAQEPYTTDGSIWSEDYVGVWHLDADETDQTSGGNDATADTSSDSGGRIGGGNWYNETKTDLPPGISSSDSGSFSAWIRTTADPNNAGTIFSGSNGGADGFGGQAELHLNLNDLGYAQFRWEAGTPDVDISGGAVLFDGQWHHVASTWNRGASPTAYLYVDGQQIGSSTVVALSFPFSTDMTLGAMPNGAAYRSFMGEIDEARLTGNPRSEHWVYAEWMNQGDSHNNFCEYGTILEPSGGGGLEVAASSILSPYLPNGIGEISFWYRNWWQDGAFSNAAFTIQKSEFGYTNWVTIATETNVLAADYLYYKVAIFDQDNHYIRIMTPEGYSPAPLLLDEIVIADPGPGVIFSSLQQIPATPTIVQSVDVDITITPTNNPTDLQATLWFRAGTNGIFESIAMTNSGNVYSPVTPIPQGEVGTMQYYVECSFQGLSSGRVTAYYPTDGANDPLSYSVLEETLFQDFESWMWWMTMSIGYWDYGWIIDGGFVHQNGLNHIPTVPALPDDDDGLIACWIDDYDSYPDGGLITPFLSYGVGSISFELINNTIGENFVNIEKSTNLVDWVAITNLVQDVQTWSNYYFAINSSENCYLRIVKTGDSLDGQLLGIDDILVTYSPAMVEISDVILHPGYPSKHEPTHVACTITSANPAFPAFGIQGTVWWRRGNTGAFTAIPMTRSGTRYQTTTPIPVQEGRTVIQYYVQASFSGYHGSTRDNQSPTFYPPGDAGVSTNQYYLAPTNSPLSYTVRDFYSSYSALDLTLVNTNVAPTNPAATNIISMALMDDYTWEGILTLAPYTSTNELVVDFSGFALYTNGATSYATETSYWGSAIGTTPLPVADYGQTNGGAIIVTGDISGQISFRYNPDDNTFMIKRAAFQDFNNWDSASSEYFSQSLGLSGIASVEETFNSWSQIVDHVSEPEDFETWGVTNVYTTSQRFGGFVGWYINWAKTPIDFNSNIVAHLKDTSIQGEVWPERSTLKALGSDGDGLKEFSFSYRWATGAGEHEHIAFDLDDAEWQDYELRATMRGDDISPAYPYLSMFSRFQDKNNYYEYRLLKKNNPTNGYFNVQGLQLELYRKLAGAFTLMGTSSWFQGSIEANHDCRFVVVTNNNGNMLLEGWIDDFAEPIAVAYDPTPGALLQGPGSIGFRPMDSGMVVSDVEVTHVDVQRFDLWTNPMPTVATNAMWAIDGGYIHNQDNSFSSYTNWLVMPALDNYQFIQHFDGDNSFSSTFGTSSNLATGVTGGSQLQITFTNFSGRGTLTNFPVLVKLSTAQIPSFNYSGFLRSDGYDLRFWGDSNLTEELAYEFEDWDTGGTSFIWVRVPFLTHNSSVYATWGDPNYQTIRDYTQSGIVWVNGYSGVWHMNDNGNDASTYGHTASVNGDPSPTTQSMIAGAYAFDGNDRFLYNNHPSFEMVNNVTIAAWVRCTTWRDWAGILAKGSDRSYQLELNNNDWRYHFRVNNNQHAYISGHSANTWYYLVGTYDRQTMRFYRNGTQMGTRSTTVQMNQYGDDLRIGHRGNYFIGQLDELRLSSVTRSADWIWACYKNQGPDHDTFSQYGTVTTGAAGIPTGWVVAEGKVDDSDAVSPSNAAWLDTTATAYLQTPFLPNGADTISFYTKVTGTNDIPYDIQVSSNGTDWVTVQNLTNEVLRFSRRMPITFSGFNDGDPLTNFPAMVRFTTNITGFSFSDFTSTNEGYDLLFRDGAESQVLSHEIETWHNPTPATPEISSPLDVSGCALWLHGNTGLVLSGSAVVEWQDQSGNSNHMSEANSSQRPLSGQASINGYNTVTFDGSNDRLRGPAVLAEGSDQYSFYVVCKVHNGGSRILLQQSEMPIVNYRVASLYMWNNPDRFGYWGHGNDSAPLMRTGLNTWRVIELNVNNYRYRNIEVSENGVINHARSNRPQDANVGNDGFSIGDRLNYNDREFDGDIAEILVYDRNLSTTERNNIKAYLDNKYGLNDDPAESRADVWVRVPTLTSSNDQVFAYWGSSQLDAYADSQTDGSTWDSSYVAVYHLSDGGYDSTANGMDAENFGTIHYNNGRIGSCRVGAGRNDRMLAPAAGFWGKPYTVSAWAMRTQRTRLFYIGQYGNSNYRRLFTGYEDGNTYRQDHGGDDNRWDFSQENTRTWRYLTAQYEPTPVKKQRLFMNGTLRKTRTPTSDYYGLSSGQWELFRGANGGNEWDGPLDEIRISRAVRSTNWIYSAYQNMAQNSTFNNYGAVETGDFRVPRWEKVSVTLDMRGQPLYVRIAKNSVTAAGEYLGLDNVECRTGTRLYQMRPLGPSTNAIASVDLDYLAQPYMTDTTEAILVGSPDGSNWTTIAELPPASSGSVSLETIDIPTNLAYTHIGIYNIGDAALQLNRIQAIARPDLLSSTFATTNEISNWAEPPGSTNWSIRTNTAALHRGGYVGPPCIVDIDIATTNNSNPDYPTEGWENRYTIAITNMQYTNQTFWIGEAEEKFVRVKHNGNDVSAVVDDLVMSGYRGRTVTSNGWTVAEALVTARGTTNNQVELWADRAVTSEVQYVESLLVSNGVGAVSLDYRCENGPVTFEIQTGVGTNWTTNLTMQISNTNWVDGQTLQLNVAGTNRVRIVHVRTNAPNARLFLDNIILAEYRDRDDTMWEAYNALITHNQDTREFEPDHVPGISVKTCYLNDGPSNGTFNGESYLFDKPYVQTPRLPNGVGEISFWYRSWEEDGDPPGRILIRSAPTAETPADEWNLLGILDNITGTNYVQFRTNYYESADYYVRITCETNGNFARVCLDNILICEPMGANFDIQDMMLLPAAYNPYNQPLDTDDVHVSVVITNQTIDVSNISMRVYYYVGTNYPGTNYGWGNIPLTNWISMSTNGQPANTWRTTSPIPQQSVDTIVQYYVSADFDGNFAYLNSPKNHKDFVNPEYYAPVDLNRNQLDTIPYYFVYSCPPYDIWINEYNIIEPDFLGGITNQFIELCGKQGAEMTGWALQVGTGTVGEASQTLVATYFPTNNTLFTNEFKGYGFWILGDGDIVPRDQDLTNQMPYQAWLRLVRSMGAWEQTIGTNAAEVDDEFFQGSTALGLFGESGTKASDFEWNNGTWSSSVDGENDLQVLVDYGSTQTLTVASQRGTPAPAIGVHEYTKGSWADCFMTDSPLYEGSTDTQYLCIGWAGTGSTPPFDIYGPWTNTLPFMMLADSTITWLWQTNVYLDTQVIGSGSVNTNGWFKQYTSITVTATAEQYNEFWRWSGDTNDLLDAFTNTLTILMDRPRKPLIAHFRSTDRILEVISDQGEPGPDVGLHTNRNEDILSPMVTNGTLYSGVLSTQHLLYGWAGTGSVPPMPTEGPATNMQWRYLAPPETYNSQDGLGWVTAIYRDGGNWEIDPLCSNGVSAGDDTLLLTNTVQFSDSMALYWSPTRGISVDQGLRIYTVIFNATSIEAADKYVVTDTNLFVIPQAWQSPLGTDIYDCGTSTSNDWTSLWSPTNITVGLSTGPFAITNDSAITWLWHTNYYLTYDTNGYGAILGADEGWHRHGTNVTLIAETDETNSFVMWSGDTNGIADVTATQAVFTMYAPRDLLATFASLGLTAMGTPYTWLSLYFTNNLVYWDTNDFDGDGLFGWQEYVTGTDPTNWASAFRFIGVEYYGTSNKLIYYITTNNGMQDAIGVYRATNLMDPDPWGTPITTDTGSRDPNGDGTNEWWDTNPPPDTKVYYKLFMNTTNGP